MTANQRGMIVLGSAITDVGRARNRNEDRVHFWAHADVSLAVVADGMGSCRRRRSESHRD
jgi:serine/threonine protein phosphatase PrpC